MSIEAMKQVLEKIANVNAMDYEYQRWAKEALAIAEAETQDPDKMVLRKPRLDQGPDYERGFIDGMQHQMQTSVDKAVNAMSRTWVGLTDEEFEQLLVDAKFTRSDLLMIGACVEDICNMVEAKLKEKNT